MTKAKPPGGRLLRKRRLRKKYARSIYGKLKSMLTDPKQPFYQWVYGIPHWENSTRENSPWVA